MLALTTTDGWRPGIGDPTFMGWFTVFGYLLASFLCWRAAKTSLPRWKKTGNAGPVFFWILVSILLLLLGFNKQLDLQTWFTEFGRDIAREQGWYERRHFVQVIFLLLFAVFGLVVIGLLIRLTRGFVRECRLALLGAVFLLCFVLMRAASFHHVDQILGMRLAGIKINWILELGGIFCIAWGAWQNSFRHPLRHLYFRSPTKSAQRI